MFEENEQVFRRMIDEGFNKGNLDALDKLFAPNFVEHQDGFVPPDITGVKKVIVGLRTPYPDLKLTIEEMIASGDKTWARITARGTHQAPFMGRPPTGKSFSITVIDICRFEQGKIVEHWGVADQFGLMRQLGLLPPPQKPL
ncbi:MAG: ester cyclase [Anaerolineae bacterium]|nr:ester cyclase [Anaerolineae bacterium]